MARKQSAISDEEIIAALLNSGSMAEAAKLTGLTARAIYDRMGYREFKAAYSAVKADLVRRAVLDLNRRISAAVETIAEIMADDQNPATARLQAAKLILDNAARFSDRLAAADKYTSDQAGQPLDLDPARW